MPPKLSDIKLKYCDLPGLAVLNRRHVQNASHFYHLHHPDYLATTGARSANHHDNSVGWKLRISVHADDLEHAFDLIASRIYTVFGFKVVDKDDEAIRGGRFGEGAQFTIYLELFKFYRDHDVVEATQTLMADIENLFKENRIRAGLIPGSDARTRSAFFSLRNDCWKSLSGSKAYIPAYVSGTSSNPCNLPNPFYDILADSEHAPFNLVPHYQKFTRQDAGNVQDALLCSLFAYLRQHTCLEAKLHSGETTSESVFDGCQRGASTREFLLDSVKDDPTADEVVSALVVATSYMRKNSDLNSLSVVDHLQKKFSHVTAVEPDTQLATVMQFINTVAADIKRVEPGLNSTQRLALPTRDYQEAVSKGDAALRKEKLLYLLQRLRADEYDDAYYVLSNIGALPDSNDPDLLDELYTQQSLISITLCLELNPAPVKGQVISCPDMRARLTFSYINIAFGYLCDGAYHRRLLFQLERGIAIATEYLQIDAEQKNRLDNSGKHLAPLVACLMQYDTPLAQLHLLNLYIKCGELPGAEKMYQQLYAAQEAGHLPGWAQSRFGQLVLPFQMLCDNYRTSKGMEAGAQHDAAETTAEGNAVEINAEDGGAVAVTSSRMTVLYSNHDAKPASASELYEQLPALNPLQKAPAMTAADRNGLSLA